MSTPRSRLFLGRVIAAIATMAMIFIYVTPASASRCLTCEFDDPPPYPQPPPAKVTVTGTFNYEDRSSNGTTIQDVPISGAKVEIWRLRPRQFGVHLWGKDAQTTTDSQGRISVEFDYITSGITYAVRVFASNGAAVVWPDQTLRTDPFWVEPGQNEGGARQLIAPSAGSRLDFSHTFRDRWIAQHFNVAETLRIGRSYFDTRRSGIDPIGVANVSITSTSGSSFYNFLIDELVISIENNPNGAFNDRSVLHEYSHHVLDHISATKLAPAMHSTCSLTDAEFAWQEGAAEFLAHAIKRVNPQPWLSVGSRSDATPSCPGRPAQDVEGFVTAALWDLVDTESEGLVEPFDQLSNMDFFVIRVIDVEMDSGADGTMFRFRAGWQTAGLDVAKLDRILEGNNIVFAS